MDRHSRRSDGTSQTQKNEIIQLKSQLNALEQKNEEEKKLISDMLKANDMCEEEKNMLSKKIEDLEIVKRKLEDKLQEGSTKQYHQGVTIKMQDVKTENNNIMPDMKKEMQALKAEMKNEMQDTETKMKHKMNYMITEMKSKMQEIQTDMNTAIEFIEMKMEQKLQGLSEKMNEEMQNMKTKIMREMRFQDMKREHEMKDMTDTLLNAILSRDSSGYLEVRSSSTPEPKTRRQLDMQN